MNCHDRLDTTVKLSLLERILQIYRDQSRLPVVTVNDIRSETDQRQCRQHGFIKESELFNILINLPIRFITTEIKFIVQKIKDHTVVLHLKHSDILLAPRQFQIKMSQILHLIFIFFRNCGIFRNHNPDIKLVFIEIFRQGTHYIGKSSCLNKRYTFGSSK